MKLRITTIVLMVVLTTLTSGYLVWRCHRDPEINFLARDSRAEWIVFPTSFEPKAHDDCRIDTVFRRQFALDQASAAQLHLRAAQQVELRINDTPVNFVPNNNWKLVSTAAALPFLHQGLNTIEARVVNAEGPPALWLFLKTGRTEIRSDGEWDSSCAGSPWIKAALAVRARVPGRGNPAGETERPLTALFKVWPIWTCLGLVAAGIFLIGSWWVKRHTTPQLFSNRRAALLVGLVALFWLSLFCNNARLLPYSVGFDAQAHADYINYIQEHRSLPLPNQGYEMFQPPLYYVLSAIALSVARLSVAEHSGILLLRFIATLLGIINVTLVLLSLRLIFPNQPGKQVAGLLFAAFLPMHLYLSHFITNELLAATLISASLFLILRVLRSDRISLIEFRLLGLLLGLALLTKATAVLLIPVALLACVLRPGIAKGRTGVVQVRDISAMLIVCLVVSSWFYIRIWLRFGRLVVGNWEPDVGFHWWQEPGFHTALDYLQFGCSLSKPFFSSLCGFADGIYSTIWGDGLFSGITSMDFRLPWDYKLMAAGYWLALVPTLLLIIGAGMAVRNALWAKSSQWLVLLSYCVFVALAFFFITLRVPAYAQVKAFYGLSLLIPLSAFAAIGWETLTRQRKSLQFLIGTVLLVFAFNAYGWAWIRPSPRQHAYAAARLFLEQKPEPALAEVEQAMKWADGDAATRALLILLLNELGRPIEALQQANEAVELNPSNARCHLQLATLLANRGELEDAIRHGRSAVELGPEDAIAHQELANFLLDSDRAEEASAVAKQGVTVAPFNAELHYTVALAAARRRDFATAANHFAYALLIRQDWAQARDNLSRSILAMVESPDATTQLAQAIRGVPDSTEELNELAWILATYPADSVRNGGEAVRLAKRGCAIANYENPALLASLAAAYAETGQFTEAISIIEKALARSRTTHDTNAITFYGQLLDAFNHTRAYRSAPSSL